MIAVAGQLRHCRGTMSHDDAAAIIDSLQRAQGALYEPRDGRIASASAGSGAWT